MRPTRTWCRSAGFCATARPGSVRPARRCRASGARPCRQARDATAVLSATAPTGAAIWPRGEGRGGHWRRTDVAWSMLIGSWRNSARRIRTGTGLPAAHGVRPRGRARSTAERGRPDAPRGRIAGNPCRERGGLTRRKQHGFAKLRRRAKFEKRIVLNLQFRKCEPCR